MQNQSQNICNAGKKRSMFNALLPYSTQQEKKEKTFTCVVCLKEGGKTKHSVLVILTSKV